MHLFNTCMHAPEWDLVQLYRHRSPIEVQKSHRLHQRHNDITVDSQRSEVEVVISYRVAHALLMAHY